MWILAAFTGEVRNYCKSRMSKEEKENLIIQNKDCDKTRINCLKMDFAEFSMLLFQQTSGRTSQSCSVLASHPVCCTDNTAQTFRHNKSWDFIEWHLHVTWQHNVESAFQSKCTLLIAASAPFGGKTVYFQSFCSCPLWLFGVWCMRRRLHAGVWLLVFLFPPLALWLYSQSAPYVVWRCARLVGLFQSSQVTDDWDICHDKYILENTLNPVGGGYGI